MKEKLKKILIITLLLLIGTGIISNSVKADSGWDSDYDSGSWDSGSDWDSGWDSDYDSSWSGGSYYGGSGGSFSSGISTIVIAVIIIIIVFSMTNNKNKPN